MIVVMEPKATREQVNAIVTKIQDAGLSSHISAGVERTIIGVVGDSHTKELLRQSLEASPGVEKVMLILQPFKLVGRDFKPENSIIDVEGVRFGDGSVVVIAGPGSVENPGQILRTAGGGVSSPPPRPARSRAGKKKASACSPRRARRRGCRLSPKRWTPRS